MTFGDDQVRKAYDMDEDDETGRENFRIKVTSQLDHPYMPPYVFYNITLLICYMYQKDHHYDHKNVHCHDHDDAYST